MLLAPNTHFLGHFPALKNKFKEKKNNTSKHVLLVGLDFLLLFFVVGPSSLVIGLRRLLAIAVCETCNINVDHPPTHYGPGQPINLGTSSHAPHTQPHTATRHTPELRSRFAFE